MYIISTDGIRNKKQTLYARVVEDLEDFETAMDIQDRVMEGMKIIAVNNLDDLEDIGITNPIEIL